MILNECYQKYTIAFIKYYQNLQQLWINTLENFTQHSKNAIKKKVELLII